MSFDSKPHPSYRAVELPKICLTCEYLEMVVPPGGMGVCSKSDYVIHSDESVRRVCDEWKESDGF